MRLFGGSCGDDSCTATRPSASLLTPSILFSLLPFVATFATVSAVVAKKLFPRLSRSEAARDGEDHYLPPSAPATLQQAHAAHGAKSVRRRVAAAAFATTIGLATVLAELILAEISDLVDSRARDAALRFTVPTLLFLLVILIPFLEVQSLVAGSGWSFQRTSKGRLPHMAWLLQIAMFSGWLFVFWSLGRAVPGADQSYIYARDANENFDSTGISMATRDSKGADHFSLADLTSDGARGLARACLERIGVIGISLMALLSGFASVSSPWHTFADGRGKNKRPITDGDIARKESGLEATNELLITKRHRLRSLQRKTAATDGGAHSSGNGLVGMLVGSIKGLGGGGDAGEIKALQMEIAGLETMESNLASSLSLLRSRQAAETRAATPMGRLLAIPTYAFSAYCIYRILATSMTTFRRLTSPAAAFSAADPINRFLGLLARHWDPKLDQTAWARQISFLLSGVILAASANSVLQTFHIFSKWAPGLLRRSAQANLALLVGQVAATYVISAALLLRSSLPREVGSAVGDALESALEPGFVDRWFEGWFLVASAATAAGIWVGRRIGAGGVGGIGGGLGDDWDEFGGEEMGLKTGQKTS